jgi:hypothetical protein
LKESGKICGRQAHSAHADIDFHVDVDGFACGRLGGGDGVYVGGIADYEFEVVFCGKQGLIAKGWRKYEYVGGCTGLAQGYGFFKPGDADLLGAFLFECPVNFCGAVAVGIGFYYRKKLGGGRELAFQKTIIGSDGGEGDFKP